MVAVDAGSKTLERIQRLSRIMRALCTVLLVLLLPLTLVGSLEPEFKYSWRETRPSEPRPERDLEAEADKLKEELKERFDLDDSKVKITVDRRSEEKREKEKVEFHQSFELDWKLDELTPEDLFSWKTLWLSLIALAQVGLMMICIGRLRRLFDLYARGVVFSGENSRCLRIFAVSLLVVALSLPAFEALWTLVSSYENSNEVVVSTDVTEERKPDGGMIMRFTESRTETNHRHFEYGFTFSESELAFIFIAVVFLLIARVMELGNALAEEQAQIV